MLVMVSKLRGGKETQEREPRAARVFIYLIFFGTQTRRHPVAFTQCKKKRQCN